MYKTLIKRWVFDDSDEIEISLPWSGGYSDCYFIDFPEQGNLKYF